MAPRTPKAVTDPDPQAAQADEQPADAQAVADPQPAEVAEPAPAQEADPAPQPVAELPASVTLTAPYGYVDDGGQTRYWQPGQVTDADQVADLITRKAPLEGFDFHNHE